MQVFAINVVLNSDFVMGWIRRPPHRKEYFLFLKKWVVFSGWTAPRILQRNRKGGVNKYVSPRHSDDGSCTCLSAMPRWEGRSETEYQRLIRALMK
jgi:hypothetical protein